MTPSQITDTVSRVKDVGNVGGEENGGGGDFKEVGILYCRVTARQGWLAGWTGLDFSCMTSLRGAAGQRSPSIELLFKEAHPCR